MLYPKNQSRGWPGLGQVVASICREIGIPDVNELGCDNDVDVTKAAIKKAVWDHHHADVKKDLNESSKLMDIKDDDFSTVQEYFNDKSVCNTRMEFKVRCKMVPDIPCNFKNKYKRMGEDGLIFSYCKKGSEFSQSHCLDCPAWAEIRKGLDLTKIKDLVVFFRKLLAERTRLEELNVLKTA
jgi:hypothetical protein